MSKKQSKKAKLAVDDALEVDEEADDQGLHEVYVSQYQIENHNFKHQPQQPI